MDHHGPTQTQAGEGLGHRIEQVGTGHPQHLGLGSQGIDQRTEQVEHGAHPEAAPQWGQAHQGRMPARGKQKRDARPGECRDHLGRRSPEVEAQGFEHIGRAHPATGAAVAVLGHCGATGGGGEGHRCGDVEAVGAITAGAAGVHQGQIGPLAGHGAGLAQHPGHGGQFLTGGPLGPQGRQQGPGQHRIDPLLEPAPHQRRRLIPAQ